MLVTKIRLILMCLFFFSNTKAQDKEGVPVTEEANIFQNTSNDPLWHQFVLKVRQIKNSGKGQVTIVHLGDSHIQGGYFTNRFRDLLARNYGVAGRGFIFPYSFLKSNGPEDVCFFSGSSWIGQKFNHRVPKTKKTGLAGYSLAPADSSAGLSISLAQRGDSLYRFRALKLYYNVPEIRISSDPPARILFQPAEGEISSGRILFDKPVSACKIQLHVGTKNKDFQLLGLEMDNDDPGIYYHSIGINGIGYESFLASVEYLPMLKILHPDCIFISLGTNDVYSGKMNEEHLKQQINLLLTSIRKELPGCCILLTTPGDHLVNKKYINPNLIKAEDAVISAARDLKCGYWDFFRVMGGLGSSKRWALKGLMFKDNLHLSKNGYKLQGELFFDAFDKSMKD